MKYLPFENIIYKTHLSPDEVRRRLAEKVEPQKFFRMTGFGRNKNDKDYEGKVDQNGFQITRIIGYRNSFLPQIEGEIQPGGEGTSVHVKMNLHPLVWVFIFIWCAGVGSAFVALTVSSVQRGEFDLFVLIPLGMLVFVYFMTIFAFKFESAKSKKYLEDLWEAQMEESDGKSKENFITKL
ncbi:MAG: hypothetical protein SF052_25390 [Bacteroidia bacterium]|nr:hypothetical protein [Bacteroidia bacterium]